jgi:hypothetical protein
VIVTTNKYLSVGLTKSGERYDNRRLDTIPVAAYKRASENTTRTHPPMIYEMTLRWTRIDGVPYVAWWWDESGRLELAAFREPMSPVDFSNNYKRHLFTLNNREIFTGGSRD